MGLTLDKFELTNNHSMVLSELMLKILDNKRWATDGLHGPAEPPHCSYATAAARMADTYSDTLVSSEHALDHSLRRSQKPAIHKFTRNRHATEMYFIQYFCLDVIFVWSSLGIIFIYIALRLVYALLRLILCSRK
jgi:hypothetical protein